MNSFIKGVLLAVLLGTTMVGCSRVDDGYVGISKGRFSGTIDEQPLEQGMHQTITQNIVEVSTRNIVIPIVATPVIKENIPMGKFEVRINYGINSQYAPHIYKTESAQNMVNENGDVFLLGKYIEYIAGSAISDVVSKYGAMEVNNNRDKIEADIKTLIIKKLTESKKNKYVNINEVNILNVEPPKTIVASVENIIRTQNELEAKTNEVATARKEQEKMEILAKQADSQYIQLTNAQANMAMAEAMKISASKGELMTVLVPHGFNGNMTVSK